MANRRGNMRCRRLQFPIENLYRKDLGARRDLPKQQYAATPMTEQVFGSRLNDERMTSSRPLDGNAASDAEQRPVSSPATVNNSDEYARA